MSLETIYNIDDTINSMEECRYKSILKGIVINELKKNIRNISLGNINAKLNEYEFLKLGLLENFCFLQNCMVGMFTDEILGVYSNQMSNSTKSVYRGLNNIHIVDATFIY